VQSVAFRLFGTIPGPIVFGAILDSACIYWQHECGIQGNCWVYDNEKISFRLLFLGLSGLVAHCVLAFLTWWFYPKKQPLLYQREDLQPALTNSVEAEDGFELDKDNTQNCSDQSTTL